jgi:isoleucyl-tRNA synthetase
MVSKYKEYDNLNLIRIDQEILAYWKEHDIFHKSLKNREGSESFVFLRRPSLSKRNTGDTSHDLPYYKRYLLSL